jgi:hypothetical protein
VSIGYCRFGTAEGRMCLNQVCMEVESLRREGAAMECPENCNGNGICNSEGHCHCNKGYAPPLCNSPGSGGSEDSGPATDPNGELENQMNYRLC